MFKIGQTDRFTYPVNVEIVGDGGKRQNFGFDATFKRLSRDEFQAMMKAAQDGSLDDMQVAGDVLLGWRGVQDEHGNDLPFSEDARAALLNTWPVLPAIMSAFLEAHTPKGKAKN